MSILSAIVATDRIGTIGKDGQIPWYLPADLKYFKRMTLGHPIIMGRKTFESIERPLPKRTNIVMTRDPYYMASGIVVVHSLQEALRHPAVRGAEEAFIVGGGHIYEEALPVTDVVYRTIVDTEIKGGDAFFPELPADGWCEVWSEAHRPNGKNELAYRFGKWKKINKKLFM